MIRFLASSSLSVCLLFGATVIYGQDEKVTYDDHVMAIFERRCFSCHNPDKAKGGLDLTNYGGVMTGGSGGEIVIAGDPDGSKIVRVTRREEEPFMPPKGDPLSAEEMATLSSWISGGVLQGKDSRAVAPKKSALSMELSVTPGLKPEGPAPVPEWLSVEPVVVTQSSSSITALATSPWAPLVAVSGQKQVILYDLTHGDVAGVLSFPEGFPETLTFSRNGSLLLAGGGRGGKTGRVVVWDVRNGERVMELGNEFETILAADISSDHARIALGGPTRKVKVYDTGTGEEVQVIDKHTEWITAIEYSPDGVLLATADRNGGLFIWESFSGNEFYELKGHSESITSLSWRADSNVLVSASEDGTVRLWEMQQGKEIKNWKPHGGVGVTSVSFSHQGTDLITAGRDQKAVLWEGDGKRKLDLPLLESLPLEVEFSATAGQVIGGDWLGKVHVWNGNSATLEHTLVSNPKSLAERLALSTRELEALQDGSPEKELLLERHVRLEAAIDKETLVTSRQTIKGLEEALKVKTAEESALASRLGDLIDQEKQVLAQFEETATALAAVRDRLSACEAGVRERDAACQRLIPLIYDLDQEEIAAENLLRHTVKLEQDWGIRSDFAQFLVGNQQTRLFYLGLILEREAIWDEVDRLAGEVNSLGAAIKTSASKKREIAALMSQCCDALGVLRGEMAELRQEHEREVGKFQSLQRPEDEVAGP